MDKYQSSTIQSGKSPETDLTWLHIQWHSNGMIKKPSDLENELRDPELSGDSPEILDRAQGSLMGLALGDAVGAHVEFRPREFLKQHPVHTLAGGGTWGLEKGQFTDDTSMALCLANSLIVKGDFVPYDQLVRYKWWFREGYMSSTGKCFDIGAATKKSLEEFERRQQSFGQKHNIPAKQIDSTPDPALLSEFNLECSETNVAGNGSLMRLAPVPLFFYRYPEHAVEFSAISGRITHGDQRACDACRYYGALIVAALRGEPKKDLLAQDFYKKHEDWFNKTPLHPEILKIAEGSYKRDSYKYIRGKGFVVQALEAALWAFHSDQNSFQTGVLLAVNLGDDTDTTAAIYGQLAGACYGYERLPADWRELIYAKKFLKCICKWIVYKGQMWRPNHLQTILQANPTRILQILRSYSAPHGAKLHADPKRRSEKPKSGNSTKLSTSGLNIEINSSAVGKVRYTPIYQLSSNTKQNGTLRSPPLDQKSNRDTALPGQSISKNADRQSDQATNFSAEINYFLEKVQTPRDIGRWVQSLGEEFATYGSLFEDNNVDRYFLFTHLNHETLQQYGMTNKGHQDAVLQTIERLKLGLNIDMVFPPTE